MNWKKKMLYVVHNKSIISLIKWKFLLASFFDMYNMRIKWAVCWGENRKKLGKTACPPSDIISLVLYSYLFLTLQD